VVTNEVVRPAREVCGLRRGRVDTGLARGGEIRSEPESGLNELRAEWHKLTKRVIPL
jgi:hypothetical protein